MQLSEFDVNDKLMPFEKWEVGMDLFEKLEREVDLVDRDLRPFIEECDGMQGLQIFTGVDDAWGGWASGWLERLRDEYGKMSIWTWGLGDHGANGTVGRVRILLSCGGSWLTYILGAKTATVGKFFSIATNSRRAVLGLYSCVKRPVHKAIVLSKRHHITMAHQCITSDRTRKYDHFLSSQTTRGRSWYTSRSRRYNQQHR